MQYSDFELTIRTFDGSTNTTVFAETSDRDPVEEEFHLDLNDDQMRELLYRASARKSDLSDLESLGARLHDALFGYQTKLLFEHAYGEIERFPERGLRLVIRIDSKETHLTTLPWELLYDRDRRFFFAKLKRLPVVRRLPVRHRVVELPLAVPFRLLVVSAADVIADRPIDSATELANLEAALEAAGDCIECTVLRGNVTYGALEEAMEEPYDFFHFVGHGVFEKDRGFLLLKAEDGGIDQVDEDRIAGLFLNRPKIRLVVLNACETAQTSDRMPFVGMAQQLVSLGIPAVVAMQHPILDDAAVKFAKAFYRTLFLGEERGRIEVAISEARNRLANDRMVGREFATPVLFLRTNGGLLFDPLEPKRKAIARLAWPRVFAWTRRRLQDYEKNSRTDDSSPEQQLSAYRNRQELKLMRPRLALARQLGLSTSVVIAALFLVSWVGLFNGPQLVGYSALGRVTDMITMILGDAARPNSVDAGVVQIQITGPIDKSWRKNHGEIIEKLSRAGASVVGFDIYFEDESTHDTLFGEKIRQARDRGTDVVVGARRVVDGEPVVVPKIGEAASAVGVLCLGTKMGFAAIAPLVIEKGTHPDKPIPSLALAIHMAYRGAHKLLLKQAEQRVQIWGIDLPPEEIAVSEVTEVAEIQAIAPNISDRACPAIEQNDLVADRYIEFSALGTLRSYGSNIFSYREVQGRSVNELRSIFAGKDEKPGKIVLIGVADPEDRLTSHTEIDEVRYGMEIHVDAIRSLTQPHAIRPLSWQHQFLISLILGALAAAIVFRVPAEHRLTRRGLFWAAALGYIGCVIAIYLKYNILLNTVYQFGAFAIVYWAAVRIERRYATD